MSESSDGKRNMPLVIDWPHEIGAIAGPMYPSDTRESWLARAARKSRVTFRQVKALYYGESKDPKTSVALDVLVAARKAREEAQELASRFESLAGAMNVTDKDFYCEDVLTLIDAARKIRGLDRS